MSEQLIDEKLNELGSLDIDTVSVNMPVSIFVQESYTLGKWAMHDREVLIAGGLDPKLLDDLNARIDVLRTIQAKWSSEYKQYRDCQKEWSEKAAEAFDLRSVLVHYLYHALDSIPYEYAKVKRIDEGGTNADMLQDLLDIYELGTLHSAKLAAIGLDLSLLEKARKLSFELSDLLATVNGTVDDTSPKLEIRNKAYAHAKEAVDEIRKVGQFVFWRNERRLSGYASGYLRRMSKAYKKEAEEKKVSN